MQIADHSNFRIHKEHRFLKVELITPHRVLSTSAIWGGEQNHLQAILNNQSCEGSSYHEQALRLMSLSREELHQESCQHAGLNPEHTAVLGTAANMDYVALERAQYADAEVWVLATAGVEGNAGCAGDPAQWHEGESGYIPVHATPGTINIILLFGQSLSPAALARSVVTMTEAKSAALQSLAVPSRYSCRLATGTGTDQYAIACPQGEVRFHWTGNHAKLGELVGSATEKAVKEALKWQNGLEPARTRNLFHILGRHGVTEKSLRQILQELDSPEQEKNFLLDSLNMLVHDPRTASTAYAIAAILDRFQAQALPALSVQESIRWQLALLVCAVGNQASALPVAYQEIPQHASLAQQFALALRMGWRLKWN